MSCHHGPTHYNVAQLWDARSGEVQLMTHTNDTISCFGFCPTGGLLAIGSNERKVMICMFFSCSCDTCTKLHLLLPRELQPGPTCLGTSVSHFSCSDNASQNYMN